MPTNYNDQNECLQRMAELQDLRKGLRNRERGIKSREKALYSLPAIANSDIKQLQAGLQKFLPDSHIPGNVGAKNEVVWPFWHQLDFDFGTDPSISTTLTQSQLFQVSQEAAFMIMSVSRDSEERNLAGSLGPWQIIFRDAQSSRQLNDKPLPFQTLGFKSNPSVLPTPYFLFPNARFEGVMSGFNETAFVAQGEGKHQLNFFGYRMRVEDASNVLSTIYGLNK